VRQFENDAETANPRDAYPNHDATFSYPTCLSQDWLSLSARLSDGSSQDPGENGVPFRLIQALQQLKGRVRRERCEECLNDLVTELVQESLHFDAALRCHGF
jgi:hypothetical protein